MQQEKHGKFVFTVKPYTNFSVIRKLCRNLIYRGKRGLRSRGDELSIHHFMVDAELRKVQVRENAFDLLER